VAKYASTRVKVDFSGWKETRRWSKDKCRRKVRKRSEGQNWSHFGQWRQDNAIRSREIWFLMGFKRFQKSFVMESLGQVVEIIEDESHAAIEEQSQGLQKRCCVEWLRYLHCMMREFLGFNGILDELHLLHLPWTRKQENLSIFLLGKECGLDNVFVVHNKKEFSIRTGWMLPRLDRMYDAVDLWFPWERWFMILLGILSIPKDLQEWRQQDLVLAYFAMKINVRERGFGFLQEKSGEFLSLLMRRLGK
jgi:hypothetical protein